MWLLWLLLAVLAVLAAGGVFFYEYWKRVQRPVPHLDGERVIPGLGDTVEVLSDRYGIPHVYAASEADLFRALGFVHARDRLWQMEQNRRTASGRLSEAFGPAALEADRFSRIVGFRRAAERELAVADSAIRKTLEWYADGVNAFISANPNRLAAEFNLLRLAPEPWTPVDSLACWKIMAWSLSVNWESELLRIQLAGRLGEIRAADLEPDYPAENPVMPDALGDQEATGLLHTAGLALNQYEAVKSWFKMEGEGRGSNTWALAPKRSATRRALLCSDVHMTVQVPSAWYEAHLIAPGIEVSGATHPGVPGVVIGHNERVAWGMSAAMCDVQDLFVERRHPEDRLLFEYQGEWERAEVLDEVIRIRGQSEEHTERVITTRHGPLVDGMAGDALEASGGRFSLALSWTGHHPGTTLDAILALNRARDWDTFLGALGKWSDPPQTVSFADVDGNIGLAVAGRIPSRPTNPGLVPAPGWTGAHEWKGYVPPDALPRLYNPEPAVVVAANQKIAGDDYPHFMGVEYDPGWRAARIQEMLIEKDRYSLRDMAEIQLDTGSKLAARLAPLFGRLEPRDPFEKVAAGYLRRWNYRMDADNPAALIFHYCWLHFANLTVGAALGPLREGYLGISGTPLFLVHGFRLRAATRLLELLERDGASVWYGEVNGRQRTREEALQAALSQAVRQIRAEYGDNARRWDWGRSHQVRYVHPLGGAPLLRTFFNRGPFPVGGDMTTPNQTGYTPAVPPGLVNVASTYRQIYSVGEWDLAQTVTHTGQSGHPLSDQYDDQMGMWREGVYHSMPWTRKAVEDATVYRMTLHPLRDRAMGPAPKPA